MHDFKVRAQAEGILTVRAFTADVHHDRLNEFYKLPMENSDGMNLYPYKGDWDRAKDTIYFVTANFVWSIVQFALEFRMDKT